MEGGALEIVVQVHLGTPWWRFEGGKDTRSVGQAFRGAPKQVWRCADFDCLRREQWS